MKIAAQSGKVGAEASVMQFFGSRPDWGFFVHGAAWGKLIDAARKSGLSFSEDASGKLSMKAHNDIWQGVKLLCPHSEVAIAPSWTKDCHHGLGHGAFVASVETLAKARLPLTFKEVIIQDINIFYSPQ